MESRVIKKVLYPSPGANALTANGGGTTKVEAQYMVATEVFATHESYKDMFAKGAKSAKGREKWSLKIKNRLVKMPKIVAEIKEEMGATGAGIRSADEINKNIPSAITDAWTKWSETAPWFFDMRDLIGEQPNLVPTGLGNNNTVINFDVLSTRVEDADEETGTDTCNHPGDTSSDWETTTIDDTVEVEKEWDLMGDGLSEVVESSKGKAKETPAQGQEAGSAGKGKGKDAVRAKGAVVEGKPTKASKKKTNKDKFADLAREEEDTRRHELDVARIMQEESLEKTKIDGKVKLKREEREIEALKLKAHLKELQMKQKHKLKMQRLAQKSSSRIPLYLNQDQGTGSRSLLATGSIMDWNNNSADNSASSSTFGSTPDAYSSLNHSF
ncbi:hypothetical protein AAF712_015616 [Marasmius tenuissimus]|uniref:No apical meristem-associated C-terminal domain-containing protein n=1 Tax=Marasmius tenuissimus TaxID=585030 RepID=A0ABR2ZB87_9AGAR